MNAYLGPPLLTLAHSLPLNVAVWGPATLRAWGGLLLLALLILSALAAAGVVAAVVRRGQLRADERVDREVEAAEWRRREREALLSTASSTPARKAALPKRWQADAPRPD